MARNNPAKQAKSEVEAGAETPAVPCPDEVNRLVELFHRNHEAYRFPSYKEAQVCREFIEPFFKALGWDVYNEQGNAEPYKEVIHQDAIKVGGATKAPDYCFRIGGTRKFFVEAKKPAADIAEDAKLAYQLRRYAWSAKLPLSILTDFEELAVYDCRFKPAQADSAAMARTMYFRYDEYLARWADLSAIFSPDAIRKGSFDKYAESTKRKRGTAEVDDAFLKEIEGWRELLARNIALRNPEPSQREMNFAVARTIDRIIFLRMCEDRGVEDYGRLQALLNGTNVYGRLCELFRHADDRYNSGLFHFRRERGRPEAPDELTPALVIDDNVLKQILKGLYYPDSPYEFSVLPADILGQVYEQFLGKVIRLTAVHRAVVEDKPEVKKAGGVYYTPTYIVDYIVEHTVGKLLDGKTPREVAGIGRGKHPLRVLDPACGSGSFLIGAYQALLDWHQEWYTEHLVPVVEAGGTASAREVRRLLPLRAGEKSVLPVYEGSGGEWRLTTAERKRLLLAHIYGVDIDPQAVEVTKLSLLLKVLEGENRETLNRQLRFLHERALPDLASNIKCGNSLIGPDFYDNRQMGLFDEEERYRINAFDWESEFPEVFAGKTPGFDAVIGNPPYIRIQALKEWAPTEVEFYKKHYVAASKGNYDIYVVFVERGLSLLNERGRLGFIVPHRFLNAKYGEPLRRLIANGKSLCHVVHFGHHQVFDGPTTYTSLLFLNNAPHTECRVCKVDSLSSWRSGGVSAEGMITLADLTSIEWDFFLGKTAGLLTRLSRMAVKLGDIALLFVGLQTDADDVFIVEQIEEHAQGVLCQSRATGRRHWFEADHVKHLAKGSLNIRRYYLSGLTKRLIFPYVLEEGRSRLIGPEEYRQRYPRTWAYLNENKARLASRNKGRMGSDWYGYVYRKNHDKFGLPKLLVPSIGTGSCFAPDLEGVYFFVGSGGGGGGGYGIALPHASKTEYMHLLGVLNSRLISTYLRAISTSFRGGYIALNRQYIEKVPIRGIHDSDLNGKRRRDRMVALVNQMLALHKQLPEAKTPHDKEVLQRQIDATDRRIDRLVYELYGLTDEEIRIVEEATETT